MNNWNHLSPDAQLWFYTAKRPFTKGELVEIERALLAFCDQWLAHNKKVHAGFNIINDQVIILGADNTLEPVSGCSIDSSVRFMQSLNAELDDADLFNRLRGLMVTNDGYVSVSGNTPELSEDTMFLNIWAATKKAFDATMHVPIHDTWYSRFIKSVI
jgi:hypothetical protein